MIALLRRIFCMISLAIFTVFMLNPATTFAQGLAPEQAELYNQQIFRFNYFDDSCIPSATTSSGITDGGSVDRFLQVLAHQESGGRPTAQAPGSSASGKYQYITSTWRARGNDTYPPAAAYAVAKEAPEAVQDAVAKIEYTMKFKSFNNDLFKLAISHFYPAANTNPAMLDARIGSNTITPRQYANSIITKINSGVGQNIGLHYKEAPQFDQIFTSKTGETPSAAANTVISQQQQTQAVNSCGGNGGNGKISGGCGDKGLKVPQGGTGVNVCYFNQSQLSGGNYNWPGCGCLPTSSLMIKATMENSPTLDPVTVLNGLRAAGGVYSDGCSGVVGGAVNYFKRENYQVSTILSRGTGVTDNVLQQVKDALGQGKLILTHTHTTVDSAGRNPTAGHFLLIHAIDAEGNFYVANPGAQADNGKAVSPARIKAWLDEFIAIKK